MEEEDEDFNIKGKLPRSLDKRENVKLGSVISCLLGFTAVLFRYLKFITPVNQYFIVLAVLTSN